VLVLCSLFHLRVHMVSFHEIPLVRSSSTSSLGHLEIARGQTCGRPFRVKRPRWPAEIRNLRRDSQSKNTSHDSCRRSTKKYFACTSSILYYWWKQFRGLRISPYFSTSRWLNQDGYFYSVCDSSWSLFKVHISAPTLRLLHRRRSVHFLYNSCCLILLLIVSHSMLISARHVCFLYPHLLMVRSIYFFSSLCWTLKVHQDLPTLSDASTLLGSPLRDGDSESGKDDFKYKLFRCHFKI